MSGKNEQLNQAGDTNLKRVPPFFESFQLSSKSIEERKTTIGGSDINTLASGDEAKITQLFNEKCGYDYSEDLTCVWPVLMGCCTEPLNIAWFEWKHQKIVENQQLVIRSKKHPFMRCTLDGSIADWEGYQAVMDAKFTMGRPKRGEAWADVIPRLLKQYSPQLHWNGHLLQEHTGKYVKYGILNILRGGDEPQTHVITLDKDYTKLLIGIATDFMEAVKKQELPFIPMPDDTPVPLDERQPYDMTESKKALDWKRHADQWKQTFGAAQSFKDAEAAIKKLVPRDASTASGEGIRVTVSKNNSKRIELDNE
jgi:RNAse (barnase) inhibitor barstar